MSLDRVFGSKAKKWCAIYQCPKRGVYKGEPQFHRRTAIDSAEEELANNPELAIVGVMQQCHTIKGRDMAEYYNKYHNSYGAKCFFDIYNKGKENG